MCSLNFFFFLSIQVNIILTHLYYCLFFRHCVNIMTNLLVLFLIWLTPASICAEWVSAVMYVTKPACAYSLADTIVIPTEVHSVDPHYLPLQSYYCFMHTCTLVLNYDPITNSDYYTAKYTLTSFPDNYPSVNCIHILENAKRPYPIHSLRVTSVEPLMYKPCVPNKDKNRTNLFYDSDPHDTLNNHTWISFLSIPGKYIYNPFIHKYVVPRLPKDAEKETYSIRYSCDEIVTQPIDPNIIQTNSNIIVSQIIKYLDLNMASNIYPPLVYRAFTITKPISNEYTCEANTITSDYCFLNSFSLHCPILQYAWYSYSFNPLCEVEYQKFN